MPLESGKILLRDFTVSDIENKIRWINNPENNAYLHYDIPLEYDKTLNWFENKNNDIRCDFVVEYDGVPVGLIGLLNIDRVNRKAEYYICIGETSYKGRGIAKVATRLLIEYGFEELKLNKIYLNVDAENVVACGLYEKSGFVCEGVFKKDLLHRGRLVDRKRYAILEEKFSR